MASSTTGTTTPFSTKLAELALTLSPDEPGTVIGDGQSPDLIAVVPGNVTNTTSVPEKVCATTVPSAQDLFSRSPPVGMILLIICCLCTMLTLVVYIEEVMYTLKVFKINRSRKVKTMWILAVYPVFSATALLAGIVPKASLICDLVAQVFFATCLYEYMRLTVDYLGGDPLMWTRVKGAMANFRSPPCCCCCPCCPTFPFVKPIFKILQIMVLQVALLRPLLFFVAAVLWANGSYIPGVMAPSQPSMWFTIINLTSTMTGVYALVVTQRALAPTLFKFKMIPKFLNYPLMLIFTVIPNVIINILVMQGVIKCTPLLPAKAQGDRIYHCFIVFVMVPFSLFGRKLYRRGEQAVMEAMIFPVQAPGAGGPGGPDQSDVEKNGGMTSSPEEMVSLTAQEKAAEAGEKPVVDAQPYKIEDYITANTRASNI